MATQAVPRPFTRAVFRNCFIMESRHGLSDTCAPGTTTCNEFEKYVAQIKQVSDEFAGKSKFKQFDPKAYKWKEAK